MFNIKAAQPEHASEIIRIRQNGVRNAFAECDIPETVDALVDMLANPETVEADLQDPDIHVLVAVDDNQEIVGTAKIKVGTDDPGELCSCFCEIRGQGMGQQFIEERMKIARDHGLEKVWFETDTINSGGMAHAKKNQFQEVASRPGKSVPNNFVIRYEKTL